MKPKVERDMRRKETADRLSETVICRFTPSEAADIDAMREAGGYSSRAELVRLLVRSILEDERKAMREPAPKAMG